MIVSRPATKVAFSPQQTLIAFLLFLMIALNYLGRQILSVLAPVMRKEIGLTQTDYAFAVNPFLLAYAFMYVGSGSILDRVAAKGWPSLWHSHRSRVGCTQPFEGCRVSKRSILAWSY